MANIEDFEALFTYHKPIGSQSTRYELLRCQAKDLAESIILHCPPSRERSLAITKLQESIMWANASIAINEGEIQSRLIGRNS